MDDAMAVWMIWYAFAVATAVLAYMFFDDDQKFCAGIFAAIATLMVVAGFWLC